MIRNHENLGISPAIEQGFALAKGDYLAFTCNDMVIHPSTFGRMLQAFEDPNVWCVTPMFTDLAMPLDWWELASKLAGEPVRWKIIGPPMPPHPQEDQMMGGCFIMSREGYETCGLDPELPDWYGDPAIWCRMRQLKHPVVQVNALIHHFQSLTTARVPGIKTTHSFKAQRVFEAKWGKVQDVLDDYNANPGM
jgi:GT2 family glycosyltransferase